MGLLPNVNTSTTIPLKWLDLSRTGLSGKIPDTIGNLKFLNYLDLSDTQLSGKIPDSIGNLTFLKSLRLSHTGLSGKIPESIGNLTFLKVLKVSYTQLSRKIPNSIGNLKFLNELDLSNTGISGKIPNSIGNLKFLDILWLSNTRLSGKIPHSIGNLRSLNELDIKACNLTGSLPESLVNLTHLYLIDLSYNKLTEKLPCSLFTLPSLEILWLDNNMFSGGLLVLSNYSALKIMDLSYNQFDGKISQSFIKLVNLTNIDLQHNKFIGSWELYTLLSSLPSLVELCLSHSGLSVVASNMTGYVNTKIELLYLASCNLTMFPGSLQGMENLSGLDLSGNYIQGRIPNWVGEMKLSLLDLSDNSITRFPQFQSDGLEYLLLHSNEIEGQFPSSICNMSFLRYLDMSNNRFGGMIPQCIGNILSNLEVINLSNNRFHGTIPNVNMEYCYLDWLILRGNHFEGDVPSFLSKCHDLKVLDIGNNYLNGTFPRWLGNLSNLEVLLLNSNSLHGLIETSFKVEKPFTSLQILDLSHNGFVGHLPQKFFQNLHAMKDVVIGGREPEYLRSQIRGLPMYYSLTIGVKGHELLFSKVYDHYTIVDLSNNKFVGDIPMAIGSLKSLVALNLSHNNLNGRIPYALGNLSAIESLDLSWNQLIGDIPQSLADIKYLAVLNLSQNHLVGRIPNGKQFDTFDETSFKGNLGLCGHPLLQLCEPTSSNELFEDDGDVEESIFTWKEVMLGYGCGTIIGFVMGYLMLLTGKPNWFNAIANAIEHTISKRQKRRRYIYIGK